MSNKGLSELGEALKAAASILDVVSEAGERQERRRSVECKVCQDTLKVGAEGHEISCPACVVVERLARCPTCKGKRRVGAVGHQVACPRCT